MRAYKDAVVIAASCRHCAVLIVTLDGRGQSFSGVGLVGYFETLYCIERAVENILFHNLGACLHSQFCRRAI